MDNGSYFIAPVCHSLSLIWPEVQLTSLGVVVWWYYYCSLAALVLVVICARNISELIIGQRLQ